jgi:Pyruvate/2-oxoacid:ferredoxin oxidoreductase delta subunit
VCPNGVFEALKPNDLEILTKVRLSLFEQQEIVFECNPEGIDKQSNAIVVPCLARIDEGVLVGCVSLGARAVWLVPGQCQGCKNKSSRNVARESVDNANRLLEFFGLPKRISFRKGGDGPLEPQKASRRELFTTLAQGAKKSSALLVNSIIDSFKEEPPKRVGSLPTCLPMKRKLLLGSIRKLGNLTEEAVESPLFCQFGVDDNCTGCQMCAFFCPTGALDKVEEEGKSGVSFKASDCTACGLCQEICYKKAVQLSHCVDLSKIISGDTDRVIMWGGSQELPPWRQESRGVELLRSLLQEEKKG